MKEVASPMAAFSMLTKPDRPRPIANGNWLKTSIDWSRKKP
jgi:hypothetical protein